MFDTRPRRALQVGAGRFHRPLGVYGGAVSRSKQTVRGLSDDPEGPAAVLGAGDAACALRAHRSSG
jgi:hypothetical protein